MLSKGIVHMLVAGIFFSAMNLGVKYLDHIPAIEIVFFRALVSLVMSYVYLRRHAISPWGNNRLLLFMRGFIGALALAMYFRTLQEMPFASAVTLMQLSPIFTVVLAIFLLRERVHWLQWIFFAIAFGGVALIKGFDPRVEPLFFAMGIGAALMAGIAYNIVRKLKDTDHPLVVVFFFPLIATPIAGIVAAFNWVMPTGWDWLILLGIGVATQIAQVNMTRAMQLEKLAKVSVVRYLTVVYAILIGYLAFGEALPFWSLVGIVLVLSGIILNLLFARRLNRYQDAADAR